jgi:4-amino-4-deoxy-L-arabinose transferase-like glycosyltransferase
MNSVIAKIGAALVTLTVALFAVFILMKFPFGEYFVCMILPLGFIMMTAGLHHESADDRKVPANIGLVLSGVYAVLIMLVYFSQCTTVNLEEMTDQASRILDFSRGGLIFNYDLLGYGIMALSTFFTGLAFRAENKPDKWLKWLLIIHGAFFPGCLIMPITGMFLNLDKSDGSGYYALLIWCIYFIPIGVLAFRHFGKNSK